MKKGKSPKVTKPVEQVKPKSFQERCADNLEQARLNLEQAKKIRAQAEQQSIKNQAQLNEVNEFIKKMKGDAKPPQQPAPPVMQARTYSYHELMKLSMDYKTLCPGFHISMFAILMGHEDKIKKHFNGDTSKAHFWSHSLRWADIEMITVMYPTKTAGVITKGEIVSSEVVKEVEAAKMESPCGNCAQKKMCPLFLDKASLTFITTHCRVYVDPYPLARITKANSIIPKKPGTSLLNPPARTVEFLKLSIN